jgi:hypothetical protein
MARRRLRGSGLSTRAVSVTVDATGGLVGLANAVSVVAANRVSRFALAGWQPYRRDNASLAEPAGLVTVTDCWSPRWTIMTLPLSFPEVTVPW